MKKNIVNYLLALVCLVGLTANAEELTQTNANDSVKVNVTAGAAALTTWENATETDSFTYGGQLGLSFENVLVKNLEVGVRQNLFSVDRSSTTSQTVTTATTGPDVVTTTTTTTTTPNPKTPKGNAWGWYKNHCANVTTTTTTTTTTPGETTYSSETTTTVNTTSDWFGSTEVFTDYNIDVCKPVTLFVGVNASVFYGEGFSPLWYAGPEGGVKVNVSEDVYLYGRVNYDYQLTDRNGDDGDQLRYGVGVGVRF